MFFTCRYEYKTKKQNQRIMKTFNIEGQEKIVLWQMIEDHGVEYTYNRYKRKFRDQDHMIKFANERCKPYWEHKNQHKLEIADEFIKEGHNFEMFGKQESYWKNEDELTYNPPTFYELSHEEKVMYKKI